ncbi:MAG: exo-alpha-sialidase [Anaerolineales bacterium]|nr:exo-alpha-sialidase [Anaerolineales bacterium]
MVCPADNAWFVALPDGTMQMLFARPAAGGGVELAGKVTPDNGQTWSEPAAVMKLPADHWSTPLALLAQDGELHLFWMVDRGRGGRPGIEYMIDIWHSRSSDGRTKWPEPRCIWKGYVGSINGMAQLRSGRIVVPFAYWRGGVPTAPPTGPSSARPTTPNTWSGSSPPATRPSSATTITR